MIRVQRPPSPSTAVSDALRAPVGTPRRSELEHARLYYAAVPAPQKAYSFQRYKQHAVCHALDILYHDKCAYCESVYRAVDARDVEHYRPKGRLLEDPAHAGYWWLASEWSNLLPSCPACNQRRRQHQYDSGMSLEAFERRRLEAPDTTSGKANSFPIRRPGRRARAEGDRLAAEDPLLINPSLRDPERHLAWVFDRDPGVPCWLANPVMPALVPRVVRGQPDPYGKASIAIYGLNRSDLVRERRARLVLIQDAAWAVADALAAVGRTRATNRAARRAHLDNRRLALARHQQPDAPYASMAKAFIALFDAEVSALLPTPT